MKNWSNRSLLLSICLLVLVVISSGCSNNATQKPQDQSWEQVKAKGELTVGMCAEYAPFESRNAKTGEIEGFDVDIANAIAKELGVKVKLVDAQWESLVGGIGKGDYDVLITCMSDKEAAKGNTNMSDVYYKLKEIIVVNKDNTSIKSVEDLKGKVVGVQTQTSSEAAADKLTGLKEIKRYNRTPEAFIDLQNNRSDAVIVGYAYAVTQMKNEATDLKIVDSPVGSSDIVIVMKKGNDSLTAKINQALAKIKENGQYKAAVDKWLKLN